MKKLDSPTTKSTLVLDAFAEVWKSLFLTPIHLDSALSRQLPRLKSILAQIIPPILLKPVSLAEVLGVGVAPGEPWTLTHEQLAQWRPALLMASRLYENLVRPHFQVQGVPEDFPPFFWEELSRNAAFFAQNECIDILGSPAPLSLRCSQNPGASAVLSALTKGHLPVRAELSQMTPWGVSLSGYAPVLQTEAYQQGYFEIQDEGSQYMALFALWPEIYGKYLQKYPGKVSQLIQQNPPAISSRSRWVVIDACAGAGGKSLAMADALGGRGRIFAYDLSDKKLMSLKRRARHAGLRNIQTLQLEEGAEWDAVSPFQNTAHVVLVDAPCTGWGVLRRNPDIKWRQKLETLERMPQIQLRLLDLYARLVAPQGRLVYGVCTFRMSETLEVVRLFLEKHPQFKAQEGGYLGPGPCDGFFMQSFIRVDT